MQEPNMATKFSLQKGYFPNKFNFSYEFSFETYFAEDYYQEWYEHNWTNCFWISGIYVALIFLGKRIMRDKQPFEIRRPLAAWSGMLALFSICGAVRTVSELVYVINEYGWEYSYCDGTTYFTRPVMFWVFMFTSSKAYELGDTLFIVLRKQPLIFLHWYHHISVLMYVWYCYVDNTAPGRYFIAMNYSVHAVMYTYYALRGMGYRLPRAISVVITSIQVLQMVVGLLVNYMAWKTMTSGRECMHSMLNMQVCVAMYFSYFILFVNYFYQTYLNSSKKPIKSVEKKSNANGVSKHTADKKNGYVNGKTKIH